ncbi:hypothetical protein GGTG_07621 [Gaeumannomyces tritici R3-111a-1]|uniref:Uncharacterized protein n=1 Tax=Gaeumannomyces tritici (strain R3-111a-1) TaxID=644352 RepID=J3P273_GAET3|nr:hypothetical protein GGTG_07621 [Gaeumannomyces tritici R3-111a-1]EJT73765.1 hypothetical protein GGTG_07621 [Gaeumannomyces tritici R3-111a-1]
MDDSHGIGKPDQAAVLGLLTGVLTFLSDAASEGSLRGDNREPLEQYLSTPLGPGLIPDKDVVGNKEAVRLCAAQILINMWFASPGGESTEVLVDAVDNLIDLGIQVPDFGRHSRRILAALAAEAEGARERATAANMAVPPDMVSGDGVRAAILKSLLEAVGTMDNLEDEKTVNMFEFVAGIYGVRNPDHDPHHERDLGIAYEPLLKCIDIGVKKVLEDTAVSQVGEVAAVAVGALFTRPVVEIMYRRWSGHADSRFERWQTRWAQIHAHYPAESLQGQTASQVLRRMRVVR